MPSEVRQAEQAIDRAFRTNLLIGTPRTPALYHILSAADDSVFVPLTAVGHTPHEMIARADTMINELRYPIAWIFDASPAGGLLEHVRDATLTTAAYDLLRLASAYDDISGVFVLASAGLIELTLEGTEIRTRHRFKDDVRYEAYNRFVGRRRDNAPALDMSSIVGEVARHVKVSNGRFSYDVTSQLLKDLSALVAPALRARFLLPDHWEFGRYSLGEFRRVWKAVYILTFLRFIARYAAMLRGAPGMGVLDTLLILETSALRDSVSRIADLHESTVSSILEDLTYGARGIRNPDPAIQPLIPIGETSVAIAPQLLLHLNPERNLCVLLNRIPEERFLYSQLTAEKEDIVRKRLIKACEGRSLRFYSGKLPGRKDLPDIDLAIISEDESICFICELKWFIEPADTRELIEKDQEIAKGLGQAAVLVHALQETAEYRAHLALSGDCQIAGVVVSENWIGHVSPIAHSVPVIQAAHFEARLQSANSLAATAKWLSSRAYLPRESVDFDLIKTEVVVSEYRLEWYGFRPLMQDAVLPVNDR